MNINIVWHDRQFNVELASQEGKDPFLTIRGCRIASGKNGNFVSFPATKNESTGKWWNHVYASDAFSAKILELAEAERPAPSKKTSNHEDDDIPW